MNIKNLSVATQLFWKTIFQNFWGLSFLLQGGDFLHRLFSKDRSRYQVEFPDRSSRKNSAMQRLANRYLLLKTPARWVRKWNRKQRGKEQRKQVEQIMWCIRIPIGFWKYRQVGALVLYTVSNPFTASVMKWKRDLFLNGWWGTLSSRNSNPIGPRVDVHFGIFVHNWYVKVFIYTRKP